MNNEPRIIATAGACFIPLHNGIKQALGDDPKIDFLLNIAMEKLSPMTIMIGHIKNGMKIIHTI